MIPFFRKFFRALFFDELSFVRWARGSMILFAAGGVGFADSIAVLVGAPGAVKTIKIFALVCGFLGGAITAGERNPKDEAEPATPAAPPAAGFASWPLVLALAALALVVLAFIVGQRSAPVKTVEKEVVVEKVVRDEQAIATAVAAAQAEWQKTVKDRTVIRVVYRDGKPVERIVYVNRDTGEGGSSSSSSSGQVEVTSHQVEERVVEREKVVTSARPGWSVAAGGLWDPGQLSVSQAALEPERYDLELARRIVGAFWIAVAAQTDGFTLEELERARVGLRLRLEF
jgi:hypothetical protein